MYCHKSGVLDVRCFEPRYNPGLSVVYIGSQLMTCTDRALSVVGGGKLIWEFEKLTGNSYAFGIMKED